jgi:hypothetical protein
MTEGNLPRSLSPVPSRWVGWLVGEEGGESGNHGKTQLATGRRSLDGGFLSGK